MNKIDESLGLLENVKEKITSSEYKELIENLSKIRTNFKELNDKNNKYIYKITAVFSSLEYDYDNDDNDAELCIKNKKTVDYVTSKKNIIAGDDLGYMKIPFSCFIECSDEDIFTLILPKLDVNKYFSKYHREYTGEIDEQLFSDFDEDYERKIRLDRIGVMTGCCCSNNKMKILNYKNTIQYFIIDRMF